MGWDIGKGGCGCGGDDKVKIDVNLCSSCHTGPDDSRDEPFHVNGQVEQGGAHDSHRKSLVTTPLDCGKCHPVPESPTDALHMNGVVDVYVEGNQWIGSYDKTNKKCDTYCHVDKQPYWAVEFEGNLCISCHEGSTQENSSHYFPARESCHTCHDETMEQTSAASWFKDTALHVNGQVEVNSEEGCTACHGNPPTSHDEGIDDPVTLAQIEDCDNCHPKPLSQAADGTHRNGVTDFREDGLCTSCHDLPPSTGAHDAHDDPNLAEPVDCDGCHVGAPTVGDATANDGLLGHLALPTVDFDTLASVSHHEPIEATYDRSMQACADVYCHGAGLYAGMRHDGQPAASISWISANAVACGDNCHGNPPTTEQPHDTTSCSTCHGETIDALHVNGVVNAVNGSTIDDSCVSFCHDSPPANHTAGVTNSVALNMIAGCTNCHPAVTSPFQTPGGTHRNGTVDYNADLCGSCHSSQPVSGTHASHALPTISDPIGCTTCHGDIPSEQNPNENNRLFLHMNSPVVSFSSIAATGFHGPISPSYDAPTQTCADIACHGASLVTGQLIDPLFWTGTPGATDDCNDCHGNPPSVPFHPPAMSCDVCHDTSSMSPHINGQVN